MSWKKVGNWLKDNAGDGVALVGSLLTGNVTGAISTGMSIVTGATGKEYPDEALAVLKDNPDAMLKLKELYYKDEDLVRQHIREKMRLELEDEQHQHEQTQTTVRQGDIAEDKLIRWTRPLMAWLSLVSAIGYVFFVVNGGGVPDLTILGSLLALPLSYSGLRQVGKAIDTIKGGKLGMMGSVVGTAMDVIKKKR